MPFNQPPDIPAIILQAAQVYIQGINSRRAADARQQQLELEAQQQARHFELQEKNLKLQEDNLKLQVQKEGRIASQGETRARLLSEAFGLKKELGRGTLAVAQEKEARLKGQGEQRMKLLSDAMKLKSETAAATLDVRKAELDVRKEELKVKKTTAASQAQMADFKRQHAALLALEEQAALRDDSPPEFRSFSNADKLIAEKNKIRASITQQLSTMLVEPSDPRIVEQQRLINDIDTELLERGAFKKNGLEAGGILASIEQTKNYLPGLLQAPEELETPATTPLDIDDPDIFQSTISSAIGKATTFDPATAVNSLRVQYTRTKASDPQGGAGALYRQKVFTELVQQGLSTADAGAKMREWGIR